MESKNIKKYIFLFLLVSSLIIVSAEINTYGSFKKDTTITIKQQCSSCTYVNVSISYPNSTLAITNAGMTNQGGGTWTYLFNDTKTQGRYDVAGTGDLESKPTSFDVLYFDINEYGIAASLFAFYTVFYLLLLFLSYLFWFKFATYNGGKIRDPNFLLWAGFLDLILFVIIQIYGFGGVNTLLVDVIKIVSFASGLYFLAIGIINIVDWKKKY